MCDPMHLTPKEQQEAFETVENTRVHIDLSGHDAIMLIAFITGIIAESAIPDAELELRAVNLVKRILTTSLEAKFVNIELYERMLSNLNARGIE
jgi:hypothetical protein